MSVVQHAWNIPTQQTDAAKVLSAKFKTLKRVLSAWQAQLSSLKTNISNVKLVPHLLEIIEELRDLSIEEWNFKSILEMKLLDLLHQQKIYWKQRDTIKWVKFGDEDTKFFHANVTISHRKNLITSLVDATGQEVHDHHLKVSILWEAFKDRLGISEPCQLDLEIFQLLQQHPNLSVLRDPFC